SAGHETTIQLLCNGTLAFLRHPKEWARFRSDAEGLAATATAECLRYDPPVTESRRITVRDVELQGKQIRKGQHVTCVLTSANRDPRAFPEPDRFDITRSPNRHLAFGTGIHFCLGQYLARLEGEEVFKALADRIPDMYLVTNKVDYTRVRNIRSI